MEIIEPAKYVEYVQSDDSILRVERLTLTTIDHDAALDTARRVVDLTVAVCGEHFEARDGESPSPVRPLSSGSVAEKYSADDIVVRQLNTIQERTRHGSYWLMTGSGDEGRELVGLINTSPSPFRRKLHQVAPMVRPDCRVNWMLVRRPDQMKELGSVMMHTALAHDGYHPARKVGLTAPEDNPQIAAFYEEHGILPKTFGYAPPILFPADESIRQMYYDGRINDVIKKLEEKMPVLKTATPHR